MPDTSVVLYRGRDWRPSLPTQARHLAVLRVLARSVLHNAPYRVNTKAQGVVQSRRPLSSHEMDRFVCRSLILRGPLDLSKLMTDIHIALLMFLR